MFNWFSAEKREDFFEDVWVLIKSFFGGIFFMLTASGWRWMSETKEENFFNWPTVIGVVLYGDYRRHIAFKDNGDW